MPGLVLREFLVLLTMAQYFAPAVASTCEGVPLLGDLLDLFDKFNRSSEHWPEEDKQNLAWSHDGKDFVTTMDLFLGAYFLFIT